MTPEEATLVCLEHGWMGHTFLHEAAHAIMAIDRDLPFLRIAVGTPEYFDQVVAGREVAGGLYVPNPISEWVQKNPLASFEMMIAGKVIEEGAFGHHLEGSWHGDMALWCHGMGIAKPSTPAVEEALGTSIAGVEVAVGAHLSTQYSRAVAIVSAMTGVPPGSAPTLLSYDTGPWSMDHDEVVAVAGTSL